MLSSFIKRTNALCPFRQSMFVCISLPPVFDKNTFQGHKNTSIVTEYMSPLYSPKPCTVLAMGRACFFEGYFIKTSPVQDFCLHIVNECTAYPTCK